MGNGFPIPFNLFVCTSVQWRELLLYIAPCNPRWHGLGQWPQGRFNTPTSSSIAVLPRLVKLIPQPTKTKTPRLKETTILFVKCWSVYGSQADSATIQGRRGC